MQYIGWFVAIGGLVAAMSSGGGLLSFVDAPSFLLVVAVSFGAMQARFSFQDIAMGVKAIWSVPEVEAERRRAFAVLSTLRTTIMGSGVAGFLIGFVLMLANMDDPSRIGPAMAVALLCALYSVVLSEIVVAPSLAPLQADDDSSKSSNGPVQTTMVPMLVFVCGGVGLMLLVMVSLGAHST